MQARHAIHESHLVIQYIHRSSNEHPRRSPRCIGCGTPTKQPEIEHLIAIANITASNPHTHNTALACKPCNMHKSNRMTIEEIQDANERDGMRQVKYARMILYILRRYHALLDTDDFAGILDFLDAIEPPTHSCLSDQISFDNYRSQVQWHADMPSLIDGGSRQTAYFMRNSHLTNQFTYH